MLFKTKTIGEKKEAIQKVRDRFKELKIPTAYVSFLDEKGNQMFLLYDEGDFILFHLEKNEKEIKVLDDIVVYTLLERMKKDCYTITSHGIWF